MELWVATNNDGKLSEIKLLLRDLDVEIHSQKELSYYSPPEENGASFEENARIKTKSLKAVKPEHWVIGEDSGIEVEGLNKLPGIHSARYAGPKARDAENNAKLLKMLTLRSPTNRAAQFRAVLIAYSPEGKEWVFEGVLKGSIAQKEQGKQGFGYDPIFIPTGQTKTNAELGLSFKNQYSHRALAIKQFKQILISQRG